MAVTTAHGRDAGTDPPTPAAPPIRYRQRTGRADERIPGSERIPAPLSPGERVRRILAGPHHLTAVKGREEPDRPRRDRAAEAPELGCPGRGSSRNRSPWWPTPSTGSGPAGSPFPAAHRRPSRAAATPKRGRGRGDDAACRRVGRRARTAARPQAGGTRRRGGGSARPHLPRLLTDRVRLKG